MPTCKWQTLHIEIIKYSSLLSGRIAIDEKQIKGYTTTEVWKRLTDKWRCEGNRGHQSYMHLHTHIQLIMTVFIITNILYGGSFNKDSSNAVLIMVIVTMIINLLLSLL